MQDLRTVPGTSVKTVRLLYPYTEFGRVLKDFHIGAVSPQTQQDIPCFLFVFVGSVHVLEGRMLLFFLENQPSSSAYLCKRGNSIKNIPQLRARLSE